MSTPLKELLEQYYESGIEVMDPYFTSEMIDRLRKLEQMLTADGVEVWSTFTAKDLLSILNREDGA